MAVVVSDTSPVRALAHLGYLDLLVKLFGDVVVPPAVVKELLDPQGAFEPLDVRLIPQLRVQAPLTRDRVEDFLRDLHAGESEALALALEINADAVLIDEADGRAAALRAGLTVVGVIGVLLKAKGRGLISGVRAPLDQIMRELDFFVSDALRAEALKQAGESLE